jgi:hypothetical protein
VESMPAARRFDAVALRAVDEMERAVGKAGRRAREQVLIVGTARQSSYTGLAENFRMDKPVPLPESNGGVLWIAHRFDARHC